ncbi:peptidase [Hokovirus HKV1]|uniref:Peptidase n=1 Tax=Hokovirus HKV1 TaxID=1977638 RepID=A0A1V0SGU9_9VIRU|nr:peptidase [Hokovirus HKV1]
MFNYWHNVNNIPELVDNYITNSIKTYNLVKDFNFTNNFNKDKQILSLISDECSRYSYIYNLLILLNTIKKDIFKTTILKINQHVNNIDNDKDIYKQLIKFYKLHKSNMDRDDIKFCERIFDRYIISGIENQQISQIKKVLNKLESELYIDNSSEKIEMDTYKILMKCSENEAERKKIELYNSVRFYNKIINLSKLIICRNEYSKKLGFNNYTEFKYRNTTLNSMNIKTMLEFLTNYFNLIKCQDFINIVQKEKKTKIGTWDIDFYCNKLNEYNNKYSLKLQAILEIFENLFMINFVLIKKKKINDIYNNDYEIFQNNTKIGKISIIELDNMLSECYILNSWAKYENATLLPYIVITMSNRKTSSYNSISIIFKNIFYAIHTCLNKNKYEILSGSNVSKDNLELITKLMDYVCWDSRIIMALINEKKDMVNNIKKNKLITNNIIDLRYCALTIYDIIIYTPDFINKIASIIEDKNKKEEQKKKDLIIIFTQLNNYFINKIINKNQEMEINNGTIYPDLLEYFIDDYDWFSILYANMCADKLFSDLCKQGKNMSDIIKMSILPIYKNFTYNYYEAVGLLNNDEEAEFNDSDDLIETENTESLKRYSKYIKGLN